MRLKTFLIGMALFWGVWFILMLLMGLDAGRLFFPAIVVSYSITGMVVGFLWPEEGWRLGLWLVAFVFIMLLLSIPFSDPSTVPWNSKEALKVIAENLMMVVVACLGAEVGAIIKRHRTAGSSSKD